MRALTRDALIGISSSLIAALLVLLIVGPQPGRQGWALLTAVAVAVFVAAALLSRRYLRQSPDIRFDTAIGTNIHGRNIEVRDVDVEPIGRGPVEIGSRIRGDKSVKIASVRVGPGSKPEKV